MYIRLNWVRKGSESGSSEYGNELSGFIKGMEFLDHVSNYQLPKYHSPPCSKIVNMNKFSLGGKKNNKKLMTQHSTPDTPVSIT
jgi:hypothetical protein